MLTLLHVEYNVEENCDKNSKLWVPHNCYYMKLKTLLKGTPLC